MIEISWLFLFIDYFFLFFLHKFGFMDHCILKRCNYRWLKSFSANLVKLNWHVSLKLCNSFNIVIEKYKWIYILSINKILRLFNSINNLYNLLYIYISIWKHIQVSLSMFLFYSWTVDFIKIFPFPRSKDQVYLLCLIIFLYHDTLDIQLTMWELFIPLK